MQILMLVAGMGVEPCTTHFCGACPFRQEEPLNGESDWGSCDKKEYPDNITQQFDLCTEGDFY